MQHKFTDEEIAKMELPQLLEVSAYLDAARTEIQETARTVNARIAQRENEARVALGPNPKGTAKLNAKT